MSSAPGCWPSPGCRNADGYSSNAWPRKVWEALHGPIPPGFTIEHQCHTEHPTCSGGATCPHRPCGRPDHITLLTHRDNVRAAHARRKALA